jgi:hypothetical protein
LKSILQDVFILPLGVLLIKSYVRLIKVIWSQPLLVRLIRVADGMAYSYQANVGITVGLLGQAI